MTAVATKANRAACVSVCRDDGAQGTWHKRGVDECAHARMLHYTL